MGTILFSATSICMSLCLLFPHNRAVIVGWWSWGTVGLLTPYLRYLYFMHTKPSQCCFLLYPFPHLLNDPLYHIYQYLICTMSSLSRRILFFLVSQLLWGQNFHSVKFNCCLNQCWYKGRFYLEFKRQFLLLKIRKSYFSTKNRLCPRKENHKYALK